jgi:hypothetical protein
MAMTFTQAAVRSAETRSDSVWQRVVHLFIAARMLEARRRVGTQLRKQDEHTLGQLGYSETEIEAISKT